MVNDLEEDQPNFAEAQNRASKLLVKQGHFDTLSINVLNLKFDYDIIFDSMQNYCKITNCSFDDFGFNKLNNGGLIHLGNNHFLILYNENHLPERINWTLAHEVGHIYLGHQSDGNIEEIEAHFFAAQLLMPEIILRSLAYKLDGISTDFVYQYFHVSLEASCKRIATLNKKYYTTTQYDELILNNFKIATACVIDRCLNPTNKFVIQY